MITWLRRRLREDAGMTTAEYAVGTIAAVAFAAVLYKVVQSGVVQSALSAIIQSALHTL
jgi:Flp pilus assembly pilin Flp